ncbi:MAG: 2-oxoacid:acceptor oxidoreductase subunit alpha [Candidatus Sumerlaeaceae bacterium]|nr:2-oxoacid:acceptor oxidoreductase subunit alpha [Candidatus Sumerlaeaceae bacterium]
MSLQTDADSPTATATPLPSTAPIGNEADAIVNDVVIQVATSNGTGSQSANLVLMRTIFEMGVPVSGKNMFPSNIQGLPTWFTIRVNKDGWSARRRDADVFVAMNPESAAEDIAGMRPGSILILNEELQKFQNRDDIHVFVVPFNKLVIPVCPDGRLRRLVVNMMYVGVVAYLLHLDVEELKGAIARQFSKKPKAAELNSNAALAGYQWAAENLPKQYKFVVKRMDKTKGKVIIDGNSAAALGLMYGGITVFAWYPITPSSSLGEALIDYMARYRHDPETGKATYAIVQAEDELAAMAMVVGAGWDGARAATSTSGPGISLMAELTGLAYFTEIPAVIVDVQRVGPSTGLPTRTNQGDMLKAYLLSHGDCKHPLLIPGNVKECYEFGIEALNLAERLQTPIFLMTDLDMGMNLWMTDPFEAPTKPLDRGKVLTAEDLNRLGEFARYRDVDGDGIGYRTLPGTKHPNAAFFTQGAGHDDRAKRSEKPEDWQGNLDRLTHKFNHARTIMPKPVLNADEGATLAIIGFGTSDPAIEEARHILRTQHGVKSSYLRLRSLPASAEVIQYLKDNDKVYLVEQNRDAQVASILRMENPELGNRIVSVLHYCGLPLDAQSIVEQLEVHLGKRKS